MTLIEVVVALGISVIAVAAIVMGYMFGIGTAQKSAIQLAATERALERIEQIRSAKWDLSSWPNVDQVVVSNFPAEVVTLDLLGANNAATCGTNFTLISQISTTPPLKRVRVDCVWTYKGVQLMTNTVETCRAPDQ
jgi:type II secretory pathway pseudopilin PulG